MRYEVVTWLDGERDQWWRVWGARRAARLADDVIRAYERRRASAFEVAVVRTRGNEMLSFYASEHGGWLDEF